jgi:hypothetical protein
MLDKVLVGKDNCWVLKTKTSRHKNYESFYNGGALVWQRASILHSRQSYSMDLVPHVYMGFQHVIPAYAGNVHLLFKVGWASVHMDQERHQKGTDEILVEKATQVAYVWQRCIRLPYT